MIKGKFLSEAISIEEIEKGKLNLIDTPTGSGKTTFAIDKLTELASSYDKILYLIDTTAGRDQITKNSKMKVYDKYWRTGLEGNVIHFEPQKVVVMTYALFGTLLKYYPAFADDIELIIADELHNIFWPIQSDRAKYSKSHPLLSSQEINDLVSKASANYIALDKLGLFACDKTKYVVALTATPQKVHANFEGEINTVRTDCVLVAYETLNTVYYRNLVETINCLPAETKAIIYIPTITSIEKYLSVARKAGFKAEGIWSIHNSDHPLTEYQHEIRSCLIENQTIPEDIDILFINKSYETSINIFSPLDVMIIHTTNSDTIIQVRGRYRSDLKNLLCLNNSEAEIEVPQEFLNRPLFKEDKALLCNQLSIRDCARRIVGWTTVKKKLIENGYCIQPKKTQGRRVDIITAG